MPSRFDRGEGDASWRCRSGGSNPAESLESLRAVKTGVSAPAWSLWHFENRGRWRKRIRFRCIFAAFSSWGHWRRIPSCCRCIFPAGTSRLTRSRAMLSPAPIPDTWATGSTAFASGTPRTHAQFVSTTTTGWAARNRPSARWEDLEVPSDKPGFTPPVQLRVWAGDETFVCHQLCLYAGGLDRFLSKHLI